MPQDVLSATAVRRAAAAIKRAADEQEQPFEQMFSALAYQYLKDQAPRLLDYLVGFQLVDRNDDNSKALGIFGFKIGDQWAYAPRFFVNGRIKGQELLWLKGPNRFIPLRENWVNDLISQKPNTLGEGEDLTTSEFGARSPNFKDLVRPRYSSTKMGNVVTYNETRTPVVAPWATPFLPEFAKLALYKQTRKPVKRAQALADASIEATIKAAQWYESCPAFRDAIDTYYPDFFKRAAAAHEKAAIAAGLEDAKRKPPVDGLVFSDKRADEAKAPGNVQILTRVTHISAVMFPSDADRASLMGHKEIVQDSRDPSELAEAYADGESFNLSSPTENTVGHVLLDNAETEECVVLTDIVGSLSGTHNAVVFCKSEDDGAHALACCKAQDVTMVGKRQVSPTGFAEWFKSLPNLTASSLKPERIYVVIAPDGSATYPFKLNDAERFDLDGVYGVEWLTYAYDCNCKGQKRDPHTIYRTPFMIQNDLHRSSSSGPCADGRLETLTVTKRSLRRLYDASDSLHASEQCKYVDLGPYTSWSSERETKRAPELPLGSSDVIDRVLVKQGMRRLLFQKTASGYLMDNKLMKPVEALEHLMVTRKLGEESARAVIKMADERGRVQFRWVPPQVKSAKMPTLQDSAPNAGADFSLVESTGSDQFGLGIQTEMGGEVHQPITSMDPFQYDTSGYNPRYKPDPQSMKRVQDAAQSGIKEVLDTSLVEAMLRGLRSDSLSQEFLPSLLNSTNELGEKLFQFYWNPEKFEEMYGKHDLPEFEDLLRTTFENNGDTALFVKTRSTQPLIDKAEDAADIDETSYAF